MSLGHPPSGTGEHADMYNDFPGFVVTVDAETPVIAEGIQLISRIRAEVEESERVEIPIVWFIRFQRETDEYTEHSNVDYFRSEPTRTYDGYELAKSELLGLRDRGDEIGWHYHAFNYTYRDDLDHEQKVRILSADLEACGKALRARHREFDVRTFRFGWFFIPDYSVFDVLRDVGIQIDASIFPERAGQKVGRYRYRYLPAITQSPREVEGILFVPHRKTLYIHDYNVVPHDIGWHQLNGDLATENANAFRAELCRIATELRAAQGSFLTYQRIWKLLQV